MAESSKGKQPRRSLRPSRLGDELQAPNSDILVPDTQLQAIDSDYRPEHQHEDLDADTLAVLERTTAKRLGTATSSSQSVLPHTFGISKPTPVNLVEPGFCYMSMKRAAKKTPLEDNALDLQPPHHPNTAGYSIEHDSKEAKKQGTNEHTIETLRLTLSVDANIILAGSLSFQSSTTTEHIITKKPQKDGAPCIREESQILSTTCVAPIPECTKSGLTGTNSILQAMPQPKIPTAEITQKSRNGMRGKKGKKIVLSRSLVPWSPRHRPASGGSNTSYTADSSTTRTPLDHNAESSGMPHEDGNLSAKPKNGRSCVPIDGPSDTRNRSSSKVGRLFLQDEANNTAAPVPYQAGDFSDVNPPCTTQHSVLALGVQEPCENAKLSNPSYNESSLISHEGHTRSPNMLQTSEVDAEISGGSTFAGKPLAPPLSTHLKPHRVLKPGSTRRSSIPKKLNLPITPKANVDKVHGSPSSSGDVQDVLHGASSRAGSTRVTKAQKRSRPTGNQSQASNAVRNWQASTKTKALDTALDYIRNACLADQNQLEDQMTSTIEILKEDKTQLQEKLLKQQAVIAEQSMRLNTHERNHARLNEEAKRIQRYAAGLQSDYEKCRKSVLSFEKDTKQALQDQIDNLVREKADLELHVNQVKDALYKDKGKWKQIVQEAQTQHSIASSQNTGLKKQRAEQTRMYEAERSRCIEIEKQLLLSVRTLQSHSSESSATLIDKLSRIGTSIDSLASENCKDSGIKDCLRILQRLDSKPLLTANDVRRVECMVRSLYEKADAGPDILLQSSASKRISIEDIQQFMRDQVQMLHAEMSRHHQAVEDGHLAQKTIESLREELGTQKQIHQKLEDRVNELRQSEQSLTSNIAQVKKERDELQAAIHERDNQPCQSDLQVMRLQDTLNEVEQSLLLAIDRTEQIERLRLEQERNHCEYRSSAQAHLTSLKEQMSTMTDQLQAGFCERRALQEDVVDLKRSLESVQADYDRLVTEASQHESTIETLRQERDRLEEKYGVSKSSLHSAGEKMQALEDARIELTASFIETSTSLRDSQCAETVMAKKYAGLQEELAQLQRADDTRTEQLQQLQLDAAIKLQQEEQKHSTEIEDLEYRLRHSENARKESEVKVRQMEAAHGQQLECLERKTQARFNYLGHESQQERDKLKAKYSQELQQFQERANGKVEELERRLGELRSSTSKTLVPNSPPVASQDLISIASQPSQILRTRKKVDRQTNSVVAVAPSSSQRGTDEHRTTVEGPNLAQNHCEDWNQQSEYFEEEYRNRFGTQAPLQEHTTSHSLVDLAAGIVPETQEFENTKGSAIRFDTIESQSSIASDFNHQQMPSELSTISSEDLSEMLLDVETTRSGGRESQHCPSPKDRMQMPGRLGDDPASDAPSSSSQGRRKSRANTASRMMPLPAHDSRQQSKQVHDGTQGSIDAHPNCTLRAEKNTSPDASDPNKAASKPTCEQRASVRDGTLAGDADSGQKRKAVCGPDQHGLSKKLRAPAQSSAQSPSSTLGNHAQYTPAPSVAISYPGVNPSPSRATGRRSSNRLSSIARSQGSNLRLSSTRNTRSKTNRYADRFEQELDRR